MKILFTALSVAVLFSCSKKEEPKEEVSVFNPPTEKKAEGNKKLEGFDLISSSDCRSCHQDSERMIGPSYAEIAAKYTEKDTEMLASKIIEGGSGVWGQVPMQPHPQVSKEDAKKMVAYILSVSKL
jgi:cytochrome c